MKSYILKNKKGLTLIELVAVVAIVAILATVAVVSYRSYLIRARLQDAKVALETVRAEEEQYRAEFGAYCAPQTLHFFGGAATVNWGDYQIGFEYTAATSFRVQATPQTSRQSFATNQKYGGWIKIDQDGNRSHQSGTSSWP